MQRLIKSVFILAALGVGAELHASGWPPFARDDTIIVFRGGTADRLINGNDSVLDNDFDLERDVLTAVLSRDVRNGTLTLREDGTFLYEHDGSDGDSDSFLYRALDGTGRSRRTTVRIIVEDVPNTPPSVVGEVPAQEATAGFAYRLELAPFFADPDEDDRLTFSARGLPNSRSLNINPSTGVLSGTPVDDDARDKPYNVTIVATDLAGDTAQLTFPLVISRDNRPDIAFEVRPLENPVFVGSNARWDLLVENQGPGDLQQGQLDATWTTSGPPLTLTAPAACEVSQNATSSPAISCAISALAANTTLTISVEGTHEGDGDISLIGVVTADDPYIGNNADLASAQIVEALSEGPAQSVDTVGSDVGAGDLNGDGLIDLVATGAETRVFFNDGARAVRTPGTSLGADSGGTAIALLDWNGDASVDIAVGGGVGADVEIFVNDGNGNFESAERLPSGSVGRVNKLAAADLDNDGKVELVAAGAAATGVLKSREIGGFEAFSLSSGAGRDVAVADIDRDGFQDIVVVRAVDRAVDVHYNAGDGRSYDRVRHDEGSVATVSAYDFTSDGMPDLALGLDGDDMNAPRHKLLVQQGGSFASGATFGASPISALLPGDINLDGWPDVIAVNDAGVHQLYTGNVNGELSLASEQILSGGMKRGLIVDVNNDQSLDLVLVGAAARVLEIYANNGIGRLGLGDRVAPVLQLLEEANMQIVAGGEFVDPGATAVDDIDGDITDQIVVIGVIDTNVLGPQSLTYEVTDRAGNTATAVRTVTVGAAVGRGGGGGGALSVIFLLASLVLIAGPGRRWASPRA